MAARKTTMRGLSTTGKAGLSEHELAERMRRILQGSAHGAQVTRAYAEFARKHADEFKREMGIDLGTVNENEG